MTVDRLHTETRKCHGGFEPTPNRQYCRSTTTERSLDFLPRMAAWFYHHGTGHSIADTCKSRRDGSRSDLCRLRQGRRSASNILSLIRTESIWFSYPILYCNATGLRACRNRDSVLRQPPPCFSSLDIRKSTNVSVELKRYATSW